MKYRCIKSFFISDADGDGFDTGKTVEIKENTVWEVTEDNYTGNDFHLENCNSLEWLEIPYEYLKEYFEEVTP